MLQCPNLEQENELYGDGHELVAGIDEAGRGALAGPVVAGAVILPHPADLPWLALVRDSKALNARQREALFDLISSEALAVGIGIVASEVIDSMNILRATKLAMMQAVEKLPRQPTFLLIDRVTLPQCAIAQKGITRGDSSCLSIACASIIAKVARDHLMEDFDRVHPGYGFARHKGYGTRSHLSCMRKLGPSPIHRVYFAPVRDLIAGRGSGTLASGHCEPFAFCHPEGVSVKSGRPKNLSRSKRHRGRRDGSSGSR